MRRASHASIVTLASFDESLLILSDVHLGSECSRAHDATQMLNRQGMYGDFFSFYFCEIVVKVNGKGGQPVYAKLAGQPTGRCTPR